MNYKQDTPIYCKNIILQLIDQQLLLSPRWFLENWSAMLGNEHANKLRGYSGYSLY